MVHMGKLYFRDKLGCVIRAFLDFLGPNDMIAYFVKPAPRFVELRRAPKPTGLLCLHRGVAI